MYELVVEREFSAGHRLRDYDGACARIHGHNYRVELSVVGEELLPAGFLVDFGDLKEMCDAVIGRLDHRLLNELEPFREQNPTSEHVARHVYEEIQARLRGPRVRVQYVRVWETPRQSAIYRGE